MTTTATSFLGQFGPVNRNVTDLFPDPSSFTGDQPSVPHSFLRDNASLFNGTATLPPPTERVPLAIVGGGIGGLTTAWRMRDLHPVILEQADRLGGKSQGESWEGIQYSIGAAYFVKPRKQTPLNRVLRELGLYGGPTHSGHSPVELGGRILGNIWKHDLGPAANDYMRRFAAYLQGVHDTENTLPYPEFPAISERRRAIVRRYDKESAASHLQRVLGGPMPPELATMLEHYCWSTLSGSAQELSAASVLSFLADEFGEVIALPAGNATVTEALATRILDKVDPANIRCNHMVVDVRVVNDGVSITTLTPDRNLKTILASAAVLACPKNVVRRILRNIEPERQSALDKIHYRSYLTANVFLNAANPYPDIHDLYLLGNAEDGRIITEPGDTELAERVEAHSSATQTTDVIFANFANQAKGDRTVLTLYRPLPFDGATHRLLAHPEKFSEEFYAQVLQQILPTLGFKEDQLAGLRITRWGHGMPVARTGLIREGVPDQVLAPHKGRVFFVEQGGLHPRMEAVMGLALYFEPRIREVLLGA